MNWLIVSRYGNISLTTPCYGGNSPIGEGSMSTDRLADNDLMPPPFAEGLDDWSKGDGTPDSPTYDDDPVARVARGDAHFGTCLELRKTDAVQRLRYMGEVPVRPGAYIEIAARVKALRGPLPLVQIAAWPGGARAQGVPDLPGTGPLVRIPAHDMAVEFTAVIGPQARLGVDLTWDARVLYAHVGLDLVGPAGGVVRIADLMVRDVTAAFSANGRVLPGFAPATLGGS
jgi:hypothetical protein